MPRRRRRAGPVQAGVVAGAVVLSVAAALLLGGRAGAPEDAGPTTPPPWAPFVLLDDQGGPAEWVVDPFGFDAPAKPVDEQDRARLDHVAGTVTYWTSGSSSCPDAPRGMRVVGDVVQLAVGEPPGVDGCTADLSTRTWVLALPDGVTGDDVGAVEVISLPHGWSPARDGLPIQPSTAHGDGCTVALTWCALAAWQGDLVDRSGLERVPSSGGADWWGRFDVRVVAPDGRPVHVQIEPISGSGTWRTLNDARTVEVGDVVVEHGRRGSITWSSQITCGGFGIAAVMVHHATSEDIWQSAEGVWAVGEALAPHVDTCPETFDELIALHPELRG